MEFEEITYNIRTEIILMKKLRFYDIAKENAIFLLYINYHFFNSLLLVYLCTIYINWGIHKTAQAVVWNTF